MKNQLEWMDPAELRNHPTNIAIYGDKPDPELVESVRLHGVFPDHPIGYVVDGDFMVIVSGHRRNQAAKITKQEHVPCVRLKDIEGDPLAIRERIILSNKQRVKDNTQLAREAAELAAIEGERASVREKSSLKQNIEKPLTKSAGTTCTSGDGTSGRTREKVADALGVGQGKARDLIAAGTAIAVAEKSGDTATVERVSKALEKSSHAGAVAAKPLEQPKKNGAPVQPLFDEKLIDQPLGQLRRALDKKQAVNPNSRIFNAAKYALNQFCDLVAKWRE